MRAIRRIEDRFDLRSRPGLPMFGGDELRTLIEGATALTVNDYEFSLICEKTAGTRATGPRGRHDDRDPRRRVLAPVSRRQGAKRSRAVRSPRRSTRPLWRRLSGGLLYGLAEGWTGHRRRGSAASWVRSRSSPRPQNHAPDRAAIAAATRSLRAGALVGLDRLLTSAPIHTPRAACWRRHVRCADSRRTSASSRCAGSPNPPPPAMTNTRRPAGTATASPCRAARSRRRAGRAGH